MNHQERYISYLLRIWQESGGSAPGDPLGDPAVWRASLESPHSHELQAFGSLDELVAFLREQVYGAPLQSRAAAGDGDSPREEAMA
jgi:hypothetical protein